MDKYNDKEMVLDCESMACDNDSLNLENMALNEQIDNLKTISTTDGGNNIIRVETEKARCTRGLNELKSELLEIISNGSRITGLCDSEQPDDYEHSIELVATNCQNTFKLYLSNIMDTVLEFINNRIRKTTGFAENACDDNQLPDESINPQSLNEIKKFCNLFDASDYVKNKLEQTIVTIFSRISNKYIKSKHDLSCTQIVSPEQQSGHTEICIKMEELKKQLTILCKNYLLLEKNHMELKGEHLQQMINKNAMDKEMKNINNESKDMKLRLAKRIDEHETLQRKNCEKNQIIDEKNEIINKLNTKLEDFKRTYKNCELSRSNYEYKCKEMNMKISELEDCLTKERCINSDQSNNIAELEKDLQTYKNIKQGLETQNYMHKKTIRDIETNKLNADIIHREQIDKLNCEFKELKDELTHIESNHECTKTDLKVSKEQNNKLSNEIESLKYSIQSQKKKELNYTSKIDELTYTLNVDQLKMNELNRNYENLKCKLEKKNKDYEVQANNILELKDEIFCFENKISGLNHENKKLICDVNNLMELNKDILKDNDILKDSFENIKVAVVKKNEDVKNYKELLAHANTQICDKNSMILAIKCELTRKEDQWKCAESELQKFKIKIEEETRLKNNYKDQYCKSILERSPRSSRDNFQSDLDNQLLEIARLNDENKKLCDEKINLQSLINNAMCAKVLFHVGLQTDQCLTECCSRLITTCNKEMSTCSSEQCLFQICEMCEKDAEIENMRKQLHEMQEYMCCEEKLNQININEINAKFESRETEITCLNNEINQYQCREEILIITNKELQERIQNIENDLEKEQNKYIAACIEKNKFQKQTESLEKSLAIEISAKEELSERVKSLINENQTTKNNEIIKSKKKNCRKTEEVKGGVKMKKPLKYPTIIVKAMCCIGSNDPCPRRLEYDANKRLKEKKSAMKLENLADKNNEELVNNSDISNMKRNRAGADTKKTIKK